MKPLCIYHGNCADGFTAAWVVRRALGDVDFVAGVHQNAPPDCAYRDVIMVDFSYKRPVIDELLRSGDVSQASTILILDHHKTAAAELAGIERPDRERYEPDTWRREWESWARWPVRAVFDMERSGAQIAWDYFFPGKARPLLVDYTGDRDLWRFKMPGSREINAYVFAHEYTFENWDELDRDLVDFDAAAALAWRGAAIEKKHHKDVAELVAALRRPMLIGGVQMPVANIPYTLTSDAGHLMAKSADGVAACYWDTPDGRVFSLRSTESGPDVSAIAALYGGGGHAHASGFRMPVGWEGDSKEAN